MVNNGLAQAIGTGISVVPGFFLVFDTVFTVMQIGPVKDPVVQRGYPVDSAVMIGLLALVCIASYVVPRTSAFGAIDAPILCHIAYRSSVRGMTERNDAHRALVPADGLYRLRAVKHGDQMNASQYIDKQIAQHPDWRGQTLAEVRRIIHETVPDVTEELKWIGTPTWSRNGILCIGKIFKNMVKVTFLNGASLEMDSLFNAELDGNQWRAIKYFEGDTVNASGLKKLLLAAAAFNADEGKRKAKAAAAKKPRRARSR